MFKVPKYRNKKTWINGILFDSKKEAEKYLQLKKDPRIRSIKLQPRYILMEGFEKDGIKYRPIYYRADFEVEHYGGKTEVIEIKGMRTEAFKLKMKLFNNRYRHLTLTIE